MNFDRYLYFDAESNKFGVGLKDSNEFSRVTGNFMSKDMNDGVEGFFECAANKMAFIPFDAEQIWLKERHSVVKLDAIKRDRISFIKVPVDPHLGVNLGRYRLPAAPSLQHFGYYLSTGDGTDSVVFGWLFNSLKIASQLVIVFYHASLVSFCLYLTRTSSVGLAFAALLFVLVFVLVLPCRGWRWPRTCGRRAPTRTATSSPWGPCWAPPPSTPRSCRVCPRRSSSCCPG